MATPAAEGVKDTPKLEDKKLTQKEVKPTVGIEETEEFRTALDKALGKSLKSTNQQLTLLKLAAEAAKSEVEQHKASNAVLELELRDLQKQHDEIVTLQFADDPDAKKTYLDKKALAIEKRQVSIDKAAAEKKLYEAEKKVDAVNKARRADELVKETNIELSELESCQTEEEMEIKALRFQLSNKGKKEDKDSPNFDPAVSDSSSTDYSNLSPREKVTLGLKRQADKRN